MDGYHHDKRISFILLVQIIAFDSGQILGQNDTAFTCDGSKKTFRVMFKHPIEIRADHNYVACATLNVNLLLSFIHS